MHQFKLDVVFHVCSVRLSICRRTAATLIIAKFTKTTDNSMHGEAVQFQLELWKASASVREHVSGRNARITACFWWHPRVPIVDYDCQWRCSRRDASNYRKLHLEIDASATRVDQVSTPHEACCNTRHRCTLLQRIDLTTELCAWLQILLSMC